MNLFLNAIDAMPKSGKLTVATEICSGDTVLIKISDTGVEIAKEDLPHIFDPFWSKGKHKGTGLGLGLAVSKQIMDMHEGIIQASSTKGCGTTFYIYLKV